VPGFLFAGELPAAMQPHSKNPNDRHPRGRGIIKASVPPEFHEAAQAKGGQEA